jgi:lipopolysaccharide export system permease protein
LEDQAVRILDRERYWAFLKAYVICFVSLIGLYIVIDVFSNFDEFTQRASGTELLHAMVRYYLVHSSQFYDKLWGIISMMAAIFTVTWMQRNNEHLAMLAAGISTYRVIRPVLVSSVIVSGLAIVNQELIMPRFADELMRPHKDDGTQTARVFGRLDTAGVYIHGIDAVRAAKRIFKFNATLPVSLSGGIREIEAEQAHYIPPDARDMPYRGGWLVLGALLKTSDGSDPVEDQTLISLDTTGQLSSRVAAWADSATLGMYTTALTLRPSPADFGETNPPPGEAYFLRSDLAFDAITRRREWYNFATTRDLILGLFDPANEPDRAEISVFLHSRLLRPVMSMVLMCISLPLVLGGYGRNMFVNLGLSLGTSAGFYVVGFITQYLGSSGDISPELSAWAPLIGFGTIAVARWDTIRT